MREPLLRAAAWYYLRARTPRGTPLDSVARFHLGNGARLERLNFAADTSERALRQSHGLMVNYLYDLEHIEKNHEAYAAAARRRCRQRGDAPRQGAGPRRRSGR